MKEPKIDGVIIKELVTHTDERGFFREMIRVTDDFFGEGFGQLSHSLMYEGSAKAWHIHKNQIDWWYVSGGVLKVVLHDKRDGSKTNGETMELLMGDNQDSVIVKIPPGVAHGCKCIDGPANLFYITSGVYDVEEEGRIEYDDSVIGYDWLKGPEIK
ncbi:MAG: dTDP-4-dehydrorhamnose 3,5-epimerase family protein [Deltaproteobacteria bacterium]|nr:dTDP-4-dehydrorhamnose 3,5-epimerase family protein [Deltaproteobacteria bacterium]